MGMQCMENEGTLNELDEYAARVLRAEHRYYQEVTVKKVHGTCPYGHRVGDIFKVTAMNSAGICGSLLQGIFSPLAALHYGGNILWQKNAGTYSGRCLENGIVEVEVNRVEQKEPVLLKTPAVFKEMTGKGYSALDAYRVFVEVRDIAVNCIWGHKIGDVFEVDPFNVGGTCCFLFAQLYPYIHVLLSGATPGWATEEHAMSGECPDTYDRLSYRLFLEKR
jgi:uncharacterized repeat protein (TIGR04076 family)